MSTFGTVDGNAVADGGEKSYFEWQLISQSISGNYSIINWQVGWRFSTYGCRGLRKGSAYVNAIPGYVYWDFDPGDGVHAFNAGHNHRPKLQTAAGYSLVLHHGTDGNLNFGVAVSMVGFNNQTSSGASSWNLPQIPRGGRIKVVDTWKQALVYVKDGGVWKQARPFVKTLGVWKETS
jgi:hypothetical protein